MTRACLILALFYVAGCGESRPPLEIDDVVVYAPLPGNSMSVGYMVITNNTGSRLTIDRISSPDFGLVEIHESLLVDGVARMRRIEDLEIPADGAIALEEGSIHLMLMQPRDGLSVEQTVSLSVHYDTHGTVLLTTTLQPRFPSDDS